MDRIGILSTMAQRVNDEKSLRRCVATAECRESFAWRTRRADGNQRADAAPRPVGKRSRWTEPPLRPWQAIDREGFQRLVTEVGLGRAGIVMGLEVSRLARNSTDWHRLLEICALADASSSMRTACTIPRTSTTGCCWASRAR